MGSGLSWVEDEEFIWGFFKFNLQVKTTAFVFHKKIMAGHLYRPEQKIKGSVCLIKCTNSLTKHADDYGLIEVSGILKRVVR